MRQINYLKAFPESQECWLPAELRRTCFELANVASAVARIFEGLENQTSRPPPLPYFTSYEIFNNFLK